MMENTPKNNESKLESSQEQVVEKAPTPVVESTIFQKRVYDDKKPARKGSFKRVVTCVVAVLLCAVIGLTSFLVVKFIPDADDTISANSEYVSPSISVLSYDELVKDSTVKISGKEQKVASNIKSFSINNYYESYSFAPYYEKVESSDSTSSKDKTYDYDVKWKINGIDKGLTLTKTIQTHIENCLNITASRKMENTFSDLESYYKYYGLTSDKASRGVVVEFNDGTEPMVIIVGDQLPGGNANYVSVSGDENVYVVGSDIIKYYDYLPVDFANKTIITAAEKTDSTEKYFNDTDEFMYYDYLYLSGSIFGGKTVKFGISDSPSAEYMPYVMLEPYKRTANTEFMGNIIKMVQKGLSADGVLTYKATSENIKSCGLDNPKCVIELKAGSYKFKMLVGGYVQENSSALPVMIEGKPQIFYIDQSTFNFVTNNYEKMFSADLVMEDIYTIKAVEFTDAAGKHKFDVKHTLIEGEDDLYTTTITNKGVEMDTESFKYLYQRVLLLSLVDFETKAEKGEVLLKVHFIHDGSAKDTVLEITDGAYDDYHYLAYVDGQVMGEVLKSMVDDITGNLTKYLNGEKLSSVR